MNAIILINATASEVAELSKRISPQTAYGSDYAVGSIGSSRIDGTPVTFGVGPVTYAVGRHTTAE